MMNGLVVGAMVALSMMQQTDTTFAVDGAEVLSVETMGGSIEVTVWDEDRIRVEADHSNRTFIEIERRRGGREIDIEPEARRGPANIVDFRITVPRRMGLKLDGQYADLRIEGADGQIEAETMQGEVYIVGGRGTVKVESTMGSVYIENADGTIEVETSASDIHVVDSSGEIYAESAGGSIILENVRPRAVDIGSTGGRVHYDGSFEPGGSYFFGAHGGTLTIVVAEDARASFNVATVHGSITSNLRGEAEAFRRGERHEFELGGGGAIVEAETFGGRIRLLRRGSEGAEAPVRRRSPVRDGVAIALPDFDDPDGWDARYEWDAADDGNVDHEADWNWEWSWEWDPDTGAGAGSAAGLTAGITAGLTAGLSEAAFHGSNELAVEISERIQHRLAERLQRVPEKPSATNRR